MLSLLISDVDAVTSSKTHSKSVVNVCEVGVTFCGDNMECYIPDLSKSRQGICQCVEGYTEDVSGDCVTSTDSDHSLDASETRIYTRPTTVAGRHSVSSEPPRESTVTQSPGQKLSGEATKVIATTLPKGEQVLLVC